MKRLRLTCVLAALLVATACTPDQGPGAGFILRVDPRFDDLVPANALIEKLADVA